MLCGDLYVAVLMNALVLVAFIQTLGSFSVHLMLSFVNGDNFTSSF